MTLLPIVERELRLAVRSRATRWSRLGAALVAGTIVGFALLFTAGTGTGGAGLFRFLVYLLFAYASLAGVFLTADCLSVERRQGTLGLLFLTDLQGYDVVLGKLVARAATGFYGWLSTLPIVAIALLIGGVTGGEFWRVALALVSILFLSLTVGLVVSAVVEQDQPAMGFTFVLLLGLNTVPEWLAASVRGSPALLLAMSPLQLCQAAFDAAYRGTPAPFWWGLVWIQALAWGSLLASCLILPHSWRRQRSDASVLRAGWPLGRWAFPGNRTRQAARSAGPATGNPVTWLVERTSLMSRCAVWTTVLGCVLVGLGVSLKVGLSADSGFQLWIEHAVGLCLRVLVAFQASRFILQTRRSEALELLLSTPLTARELVDGQIQALQRLFFGPGALAIAVYLLPAGLLWLAAGHPVPLFLAGDWLMSTGLGTYYSVLLVADLYATAWLGMLLGLTSRRPQWVPLLTLLYLVVLPAVAFCVPRILIDLPVILIAQDRLRRDFTHLARRTREATGSRRNRPILRPPPLPPPLPADLR